MDLRNIAIIAHVDHGKTTLVDGLLKQSKTFRENESYMTQDLIMDSNDQERERGITILAKNTSVIYKDCKINIVDTPGHADFSGEVERTLNMADGALLLVDAQEGPMPQTKFVLSKALELGLKIIVVINKIDKKDADIKETLLKVNDLFLELAHEEAHLDFPVLYAIGKLEKAWVDLPTDYDSPADLTPIFDAIIQYIPAPIIDTVGSLQIMISALDWDSYKGKYAVGLIKRGSIHQGDIVTLIKHDGSFQKSTIDKIYTISGLKRQEVPEAQSGEIVSITGISEAEIGDTIADYNNPEQLPVIKISEPTLSISIGPNTSPFVGKEGTLLSSRQLLKRIEQELQTNVAMKFRIDESGQYILSGRGELHICIFLEKLRREGFELEIGKPQVITHKENGVDVEPIEEFTVDVPNEFKDAIIGEFSRRNGLMLEQTQRNANITRLVFEIPTRSVLGLRSLLLTLSKGNAICNSVFMKYQPVTDIYRKTRKGLLIASDAGKATAYGMRNAQERGVLMIKVGTLVYSGMAVGINSRDEDLELNVCKEKHLTNNRSQGEDGIILNSTLQMSLEQCFGFIEEDELLEITPQNLRVRKKILDSILRFRVARKNG